MLEGHRKLIAMVQEAQPTLTDSKVTDLINKLRPTLQAHERRAASIVDSRVTDVTR